MRAAAHLATVIAALIAGVCPSSAGERSVVADAQFRMFLERVEEGTRRFINGDTASWKALVALDPDVMIMGAWGAWERGQSQVSARYDWAGARFRPSGSPLSVEYLASAVGADLAWTVAVERSQPLLVGQEQARPMALRVTHLFRRQAGEWRLALRHADPLVEKTPAAAVLNAEPGIPAAEAAAVVAFWRDAGPSLWFAKDDGFDRRFRERFLGAHEAAARGELDAWQSTAEGAFALAILLDQFPRNAFRGTARMYDTDAMARRIADAALVAGHDKLIEPALRLFFYLPFGHSESLADQERSVALVRQLGEPSLTHALRHRDIIRRFGRFPHRNPILGRPMRDEEQQYLDNGGFKG